MSTEEALRNFKLLMKEPMATLFGGVLIGVLCLVLYAFGVNSISAKFSHVFSTMCLLAGASIAMGGFLGFLFGIPKTNGEQNDQSEDNQLDIRKYERNTNLEQMSDWLSKILVGVGLTQLLEFPEFLDKLTAKLSTILIKAVVIEQGAIIFTLLYFFVLGFFLGFLWAGLHLDEMLQEKENKIVRMLEDVDKFKVSLNQLSIDTKARSLVDKHLSSVEDPIDKDKLFNMIGSVSGLAAVDIFRDARRARRKYWRNNENYIVDRTSDVFDSLIKRGGSMTHKNYAQYGYSLMRQSTPDYKLSYSSLLKAIDVLLGSGDENEKSKYIEIYRLNKALAAMHLSNENDTKKYNKEIWDDLDSIKSSKVLEMCEDEINKPLIEEWKRKNPKK